MRLISSRPAFATRKVHAKFRAIETPARFCDIAGIAARVELVGPNHGMGDLMISSRMRLVIVAVGVASWLVAAPRALVAQQDEAAIRAAGKAYLEALNRGDAKALTAAWTPDGDYVSATGQRVKAHDMIKQEFAEPAQAEAERPQLSAVESTIRLVTPEVAIEDGAATSDGAPRGHFTAVWVKRGGKWLLDALRESASPPEDQSSPLDQLAWLIGEWSGQSNDLAYDFNAKWSEDGHFIERKFTVKRAGQDILHGTQKIGWDASEQVIRSWAFDSQGGYGDGVWGRDGDVWHVETRGVLSDGKSVESSNTYELKPDGKLEWTVKYSQIDGKPAPEFKVSLTKQSAP